MSGNSMTFQDMILSLQHYWADRGCTVMQPYDSEVGAGTTVNVWLPKRSDLPGPEMTKKTEAVVANGLAV